MDVRVFLTGSAGFVGTAILDALLSEHPSWTYVASDLLPEAAWERKHDNVNYMRLDIRDRDQVQHAVSQARPTVIVHSAGIVPQGIARYTQDRRDEVMDTNVGGTVNMIAAAKACGVSAFILTGSCTAITDDLDHEYPNMTEEVPFPTKCLLYGESKAAAESVVLSANSPPHLKTCVLRPSVIFGPGDYQLIPSIHACIALYQTPFLLGGGDNLYDFTHVDNVAHAHVLAINNLTAPDVKCDSERSAAGQAIFISNGAPVTFRDFCLAVWAQFGHVPPWTIKVPSMVAGIVGWGAELVPWVVKRVTGKMPTITALCRGSVKDAMGTRYASIEKARRTLGYEPKVELWDGVSMSCSASLQSGRTKQ